MEHKPRVPGYEVLEALGQGASATVWRARRLGDGLVVALKVLAPAGGDVAAGLREAGLLAGVRHQHVVRLYDVLPLPDPDTGRPGAVALATQLAGGGSLAQVLARRRILSAGELVTALQPVAGALADLHGQGVVHGDLSTGNVLFLRDGMPLLADLGAARITGAPAGDPQGTGADSGLVAPEVMEGFAPTQESDVYQLGAIAWLCLAGGPPGPVWSRGSLEELAPGLPAGLADLVTRCLAPEPGDRPDAEEVALALLASATPEPVEVAPDADPGHGLTERLRRQAKEDLGPGAVEGARRRSLPWRRRERRSGGRSRSGTHRPARVGAGGSVHGRSPTRLVVVLAAVVVVVGAVAAAPVVGPALGELVGAVRGETATASSASSPSVAGDDATGDGAADGEATAHGAADGDAVGERAADVRTGDVRPDVVAELQALVDGRAVAWRDGDAAVLDRVLAPGSPALDTEAAALGRAEEQGLRYPGLTFVVEQAAVVEQTDGSLTVDAVVTRDPLRGVGASGETVVEEPASTEEVRLVLTRAGPDDPWRLWSWAPGQRSR